jgi:hypothetical protein
VCGIRCADHGPFYARQKTEAYRTILLGLRPKKKLTDWAPDLMPFLYLRNPPFVVRAQEATAAEISARTGKVAGGWSRRKAVADSGGSDETPAFMATVPRGLRAPEADSLVGKSGPLQSRGSGEPSKDPDDASQANDVSGPVSTWLRVDQMQ